MPVLKGRDQIPINPDLERLVRVFKPSSGRGLQPEKRSLFTHALKCRGVGYTEKRFLPHKYQAGKPRDAEPASA